MKAGHAMLALVGAAIIAPAAFAQSNQGRPRVTIGGPGPVAGVNSSYLFRQNTGTPARTMRVHPTPTIVHHPHAHHGHPHFHPGFGYCYGYGYGYAGRFYYPWGYYNQFALGPLWNNRYAYHYGTGNLVEAARRIDPVLVYRADPDAQPAETQARELTAEELMHLAFVEQRYADAVSVIHRMIADLEKESGSAADEQQTDRDPLALTLPQLHRLLALALVGEESYEAAVRHMLTAYEGDESLVDDPLNGARILQDDRELRALLKDTVHYATRTRDPDAWHLVAMLMDAEGREERAEAMRAKAERIRAEAAETDAPDEPEKEEDPFATFRLDPDR